MTVLSDKYWGEKADKATKMIGKEKSEEFLKKISGKPAKQIKKKIQEMQKRSEGY